MPWFKVDDNLGFHHKVIAAGNPAMGLWVRAGSICAQQLTDGFVPDHMVAALGTVAQAKKLTEVGLWDRVKGGYRFHGWGERQPSKADVEAERAAAKERMRAFRAKKKGVLPEASSQVSDSGSADVQANERRTNAEVQDVFGDPDPTHPDPSRPDPSTTRELALREAPRPDVDRLCNHLADRIEANGANRPNITGKWRDAARLMLDRDGRTEEDVHLCIKWCQADEFWRSNILSMPKLREKFDQLRMQAQRTNRPTSRQQETDALFDRAMQRARSQGGHQ